MAEASPKVRVVRAHRQLCHGDGRRPFHAVDSLITNREGSSLLHFRYRSDCDVRGFPTVETIVDGGIHSGNEVTNFHPICDGSKLVHEAMKSKVGPPICSIFCCSIWPASSPSKISASFFAYLADESQISGVQEVSQIHQSDATVGERQISGAVWARSLSGKGLPPDLQVWLGAKSDQI